MKSIIKFQILHERCMPIQRDLSSNFRYRSVCMYINIYTHLYIKAFSTTGVLEFKMQNGILQKSYKKNEKRCCTKQVQKSTATVQMPVYEAASHPAAFDFSKTRHSLEVRFTNQFFFFAAGYLEHHATSLTASQKNKNKNQHMQLM